MNLETELLVSRHAIREGAEADWEETITVAGTVDPPEYESHYGKRFCSDGGAVHFEHAYDADGKPVDLTPDEIQAAKDALWKAASRE